MIINFNPRHGAEYHGIEQTFRFAYGEIAAEYLLLTLTHGYPLNVALTHGYPLNVAISQEVA